MRAILLLCLLSASCTPIHSQVLTTRDAWTGAYSITVSEREVYRDAAAILVARPIVLTDGTTTRYGVLLNLRRRDANAPNIMQVTSLGRVLAYEPLDRLRTHCIDGCQKAEVGVINLSATTFAIAARTGLPLRVWGARGRAAGTIPAEAFTKVLAQTHPAP